MGFEMRKNVVYCSNFNCAFYIHTLFVRMEDIEIINRLLPRWAGREEVSSSYWVKGIDRGHIRVPVLANYKLTMTLLINLYECCNWLKSNKHVPCSTIRPKLLSNTMGFHLSFFVKLFFYLFYTHHSDVIAIKRDIFFFILCLN